MRKKRENFKDDLIDENELSHEDYYEGIEIDRETKEILKREKKLRNLKRISLIIFFSAFAVLLYINKDNFSPEKISKWVETTIFGTVSGDGFPVMITGSSVSASNIVCDGESVAVLSNTSFTITKSNGSQLLSYRHSYPNPSMENIDGKYILYSIGGQNYTIVDDKNNTKEYLTDDKVIAADISQSGRYAVATQPVDYNSTFSVYLSDGSPKFSYDFAQGYITAIKLDDSGRYGMVALVESENAQMYSQIYLFDFDNPKPIAQYKSNDNIISKITYNGGSQFYFIGDKSLVRANNSSFEEFNYDGKSITAIGYGDNVTAISLTVYSGDGPCEIYVFDNSISPKTFDTKARVDSLDYKAGTVAALTNNNIDAYNVNGYLIGSCYAGYDSRSFALINSKSAYILGLREIRLDSIS